MLTIATVNEFGSRDGRIPERSYLRSTFDEERRQVRKLQRRVMAMIVLGRLTSEAGLAILGMHMQSKVRQKITDLQTPPNKPSTIAKKGTSNPLIETGQLRRAITYEVTTRNGSPRSP